VDTKVCNKCGETLALEMFDRVKINKDGHGGDCKKCKHEYMKVYREKNKKTIKISQDKYIKNNKTLISEKHKLYYEKNKEMFQNRRKQWHKNNKEKTSIRMKAWRKDNIEVILEKSRVYRDENREFVTDYNRKYYKNNKKVMDGHSKQYYQANEEKIKQYNLDNKTTINQQRRNLHKKNPHINVINCQNRRAKKMALTATLTSNQWNSIRLTFNNKCAYCGKELPLAQEHFLPLSKGGEYTHNNIIPSCKSCNSSKGNKDFFEWYPKHKSYAKKREKFILEYLNYKDGIQQLAFTI